MGIFRFGLKAVEHGLIPDRFTRYAIRQLCQQRLRQVTADNGSDAFKAFQHSLRVGPIALHTQRANEQHYELPPAFFEFVLGKHRKYSCCYWDEQTRNLNQAEAMALAISCERAELANGQRILELGCGWGSLSLWMAEAYPHSEITAVSNSEPQRQFIEDEARRRSLNNLQVITCDINQFEPPAVGTYDRVLSIEMFEHMRNYELLLHRIRGWMKPDGQLFVHIFCHRDQVYPFETTGDTNWMGRYFFTGGLMPRYSMFDEFRNDMIVANQWKWSGLHYQKTADAWLAHLDRNVASVKALLQTVYGNDDSRRWLIRWRMFFLACSELFGFANGDEWFVGHYLLKPR